MAAVSEIEFRAGLNSNSLRTRLVTGAFWSFWGATVSRGLTLIAAIAAGRLLGATGFGQLGMIQSTLGLLGVFAGGGLSLTVTKYVAEHRSTNPDRSGKYIALSTRIAILSGLVASAILFWCSPLIAGSVLGARNLIWELRVATGFVLFGAITGVQIGVIIGLEDFRTMAVMAVIRGICLLVMLTIGAYLFGLMGAVLGLVAAEAISAIANHMALRQACRKAFMPVRYQHVDWGEFMELCRFAFPAMLSSLAVQPAMWFSNIILVNQPGGYAALGLFVAADKWRQILLFLPSSMSSIILPMLSNLHGSNNIGGYRKVFKANLLVNLGSVLAPAILLLVFSRLAMSAYGREYQNGWLTLVILSASGVAMVLNNVLGQVLVSVGLIWWRFALDSTLAVLLALFAWLLVPIHQENGLALANLIAFAATALTLLIIVRYVFRSMRLQMVNSGAHLSE